MKTPKYEEFTPVQDNLDYLKGQLSNRRAGESPVVIKLENSNYTETSIMISKIKEALDDMCIHPGFPYPIYVVTKLDIPNSPLPLVKSVENLPKFFNVNIKRLKTKEISLLQKTELIALKINNLDLAHQDKKFARCVNLQKKLFLKVKENDYYEKLIERLNIG